MTCFLNNVLNKAIIIRPNRKPIGVKKYNTIIAKIGRRDTIRVVI